MPDPKLKTAAAEIEAILQKHDVAGLVILSSPTHLEYQLHVAARWSCCLNEDHGEKGKAIRIKALRADYPSKEAQAETLKNTVGLILGMSDCCESMIRNLTAVAQMIGTKMEVSHFTRHESDPPPS